MPETQGSGSLPGILATIVRTKREELAELRTRTRALERKASEAHPARDFARALDRRGDVALIAECKRRSPGAGDIRPDLDPAALAGVYESAGAAALSVLTDARYFGGSNADLGAARSATSLPALRKDFTLDPLHILEARAVGADAVLLIVRILTDEVLRRLLAEARSAGMAALVEAHDLSEVHRALDAGARILGVNNRDLATFTTNLETTLRVLGDLPDDVTVVSESGIREPEDIARLGAAGVHAVLVGEALLGSPDPGLRASELVDAGRGARPLGPGQDTHG